MSKHMNVRQQIEKARRIVAAEEAWTNAVDGADLGRVTAPHTAAHGMFMGVQGRPMYTHTDGAYGPVPVWAYDFAAGSKKGLPYDVFVTIKQVTEWDYLIECTTRYGKAVWNIPEGSDAQPAVKVDAWQVNAWGIGKWYRDGSGGYEAIAVHYARLAAGRAEYHVTHLKHNMRGPRDANFHIFHNHNGSTCGQFNYARPNENPRWGEGFCIHDGRRPLSTQKDSIRQWLSDRKRKMLERRRMGLIGTAQEQGDALLR